MMNLSTMSAMALLILTTLMWGSWFQFGKRLNGYPVPAFMIWLYTFSVVIVWAIIGLIKPYFTDESFLRIAAEKKKLCLFIIICGAFWSVGVQINMRAIKNVGMILSTSITATASIVMGTGISCYFGGLRSGQSLEKIYVGALVLLISTIVSQMAAVMRDKDRGEQNNHVRYRKEMVFRMKNLGLLLVSSLCFTPLYAFVQSAFVKTDLRPEGIPQLLCIGLVAVGAMAGTWIFSGILLTVSGQWSGFFQKRAMKMALVSAVCHFGGNLGYAISAPVLSYAVAWPISTSYNIWHYVWGIAYGEFRNTSWKTKVILGLGMMGMVAGVLILGCNK